MVTSLQGPLKYRQQAGIIYDFGKYVSEIGSKVLIVLSPGSQKRIGQLLRESLEKAGCSYEFCTFSGDISYTEIDRVASAISDADCDIVAGIGGGRVIDTARAAADLVGKRLVIVPTTASNDAPCSAVVVIHDENGRTIEVRNVKRNPDLVLVDTDIIAKAPDYYLSAGIGDALATRFEAKANSVREMNNNNGQTSTRTALAMSNLCYDLMIEHGVAAIQAVKNNTVNYALEQVVHAAIFLSGYGFENGGVGAAHATNNGFTSLPQCRDILHGHLVGFGVLVQLELEQAPDEEKTVLREFMRSVGLPVNLKELGLEDLTEEELRKVSEAASEDPPMKCMPFDISSEDVYQAILAADKGL